MVMGGRSTPLRPSVQEVRSAGFSVGACNGHKVFWLRARQRGSHHRQRVAWVWGQYKRAFWHVFGPCGASGGQHGNGPFFNGAGNKGTSIGFCTGHGGKQRAGRYSTAVCRNGRYAYVPAQGIRRVAVRQSCGVQFRGSQTSDMA
jgi:hypothetical protein